MINKLLISGSASEVLLANTLLGSSHILSKSACMQSLRNIRACSTDRGGISSDKWAAEEPQGMAGRNVPVHRPAGTKLRCLFKRTLRAGSSSAVEQVLPLAAPDRAGVTF